MELTSAINPEESLHEALSAASRPRLGFIHFPVTWIDRILGWVASTRRTVHPAARKIAEWSDVIRIEIGLGCAGSLERRWRDATELLALRTLARWIGTLSRPSQHCILA